jgi:hypothetical protein
LASTQENKCLEEEEERKKERGKKLFSVFRNVNIKYSEKI